MCEKYQYTVIFYQQSLEEDANTGLTPILDYDFVRALPLHLNLNINELEKAQPIICGTVVDDKDFGRKLKMLRAELFTALLVCQHEKFTKNVKVKHNIKHGVVQMAMRDQRICDEDIIKKTKNWHKIVDDMVNHNTYMDIESINIPKDMHKKLPD